MRIKVGTLNLLLNEILGYACNNSTKTQQKLLSIKVLLSAINEKNGASVMSGSTAKKKYNNEITCWIRDDNNNDLHWKYWIAI